MCSFKIVKKGYSQLEVDSYIEKLKEDYEARLAEQKDRIFYLKDQLDKITNSSDNELVTSLVGAVERARMIETSSKNIYELETKKLSLLYTKMESLLTDENIRNDRSVKKELLELIQDCRSSLESNITAQSENIKETTSGDPVKTLLSKMIDFNKVTADYNLTKREAKIIEENNKRTIKVIPTNEVIRKEVPSSVKVVQVRRTTTNATQAQNVLSNTTTTNEFDKFLSQNSDINGSNFENIMFTKSSSSSGLKASTLSKYSSRRERIQQSKKNAQEKASAKSKELSKQENIEKVGKLSSSSKSQDKLSLSLSSSNSSATSKSSNSQTSLYGAKESKKTGSSTISKYSYDSATGLKYDDNYLGIVSNTRSSNNSSKTEKSNSSAKILDSSTKTGESYNSKLSLSSSSKNVESNSKLSTAQSLNSSKSVQKTNESSNKFDSEKNNDEIIISTKSKADSLAKRDDKSSILITGKAKTENTSSGKTESKQINVSGSNGNTNFAATATYKSSYSSTSSSSGNPNDELSDEEFLRAYLGDLEFEEQERQKKSSSSLNSSYTKTTQTTFSSTTTTTSSSKRSSGNAYVTGGKMGDYSPNETGFDLKEAINPKEDLDEIMKAFDFFNDNKKKK